MSNPTEQRDPGQPELSRISWGLGLCLFLGIALFFLWQEHKAHILGALPYAVSLPADSSFHAPESRRTRP